MSTPQDLTQLSDEELLALYKQNQANQPNTVRPGLNPDTFQPSPTDVAKADELTGLNDYGFFPTLLAGAGKAFVDTGRGLSQLVTGGATDAQKQDQGKEDQLFAEKAGKTGAAGELLGLAAQALPLGSIGIGRALGGGLLGTAAEGGLIGGVSGGTRPLTPETSLGHNIVEGAALGAGAGALFSAGGKIINNIVNGKGNNQVKSYLQDQISSMNPDQLNNFQSVLGKYSSEGRVLTPAQAIGTPSSQNEMLNLISSNRGKWRLQDASQRQQQQDIAVLADMSRKLPNTNAVSPATLTEAYEQQLKANAKSSAAPYYQDLQNKQLTPNDLSSFSQDPAIIDAIKKASTSGEVEAATRERLGNMYTQLRDNTIDQNANPFTAADLHGVYKYLNTLRGGQYNDAVRVSKDAVGNVLSQFDSFNQGNKAYTDNLQLLNNLRNSNLYSTFKNSPGNIFTMKSPDKAAQLAGQLQQDAPQLVQKLSLNKLHDLVNTFGTDIQPNNLAQQLDRVSTLSGNPLMKNIVDNIKGIAQRPQLIGKVPTSASSESSVLSLSPTKGISINPSAMLNIFKSPDNEKALADLLTNPQKWGPLAEKILANGGGPSQVQKALDMIRQAGEFDAGALPSIDLKHIPDEVKNQ